MIFAFLKKIGWLLGAICCLCVFVGGCAVPWILHKESVLSVVAYMLIEIPIGGWGLIYCVKKYRSIDVNKTIYERIGMFEFGNNLNDYIQYVGRKTVVKQIISLGMEEIKILMNKIGFCLVCTLLSILLVVLFICFCAVLTSISEVLPGFMSQDLYDYYVKLGGSPKLSFLIIVGAIIFVFLLILLSLSVFIGITLSLTVNDHLDDLDWKWKNNWTETILEMRQNSSKIVDAIAEERNTIVSKIDECQSKLK